MLTRLEVDGFKNLLDFSLDFGPLTCIAGPNGVGKSNIVDAIQFLSLLADHTLMDAALRVRGNDPETGDPSDLFWTDGTGKAQAISLAAEMIVERDTRDDFGRDAKASSTFLRYELKLGYEEPADRGSLGGIVLLSEELNYITEGQAVQHLKFPHSAAKFRRSVVDNHRRAKTGYITVENSSQDGQTEIIVHQDGGSRGPGQKSPAESAPRTIVSLANTSATPTILAARREMQRWRILGLEPTAMRRPDRFQTDPNVTTRGGHLAATLHRLIQESSGEDGDAMARIVDRLSELVQVQGLRVTVDEVRRLLTLEVEESGGLKLPASSLSDGTLRFLSLSILAEDPTATGVLCLEEPENGIHPEKLAAMATLLRELAVDPSESPGSTNVVRQVIVATHSPYFVRLQDQDDLVFASEVKISGFDRKPTRTLRCRPLQGSWRDSAYGSGIGRAAILSYLTEPPGVQLSFLAKAS